MTRPTHPPIGAGEVFSRHGHVTMLTLDRFECGELPTSEVDRVATHLGECAACAELLALAGETPSLRPRTLPKPPPENTRWASAALATGVAVAAAAALAVWLQPEQASRAPLDDGRLNASAYTTTAEPEVGALQEDRIEVRVFVGGRELTEDDQVAPAEPLRIEVEAAAAGYAAILVTHHPDGEAFLHGGGTGEAEGSGSWEISTDVHELEARTAWSHTYHGDTAGASVSRSERLWVLWCAEPFSARDIERVMQGEGSDCVYESVVVRRRSAPTR